MADNDEPDLTEDELAELTDEERDALNDEDAEDEANLDLRAPFQAWVQEHFAVVETVGTKGIPPWCDRWFDHPEVVARLFAVWQASIQVRHDDSLDASSNWWLNHWDRHAVVLFDPQNGPFRHCDRDRGHLVDRKSGVTSVITPKLPGPDWEL